MTDDPTQHPPSETIDTAADAQDPSGPSCDVCAAEEAVRRAKAELQKARQLYRQARSRAVRGLRSIREASSGGLVEGTLKLVKQHPGPSLLVAVVLGFFLGRSLRR